MVHLLTIEDMQNLVKRHGGRCLSKIYHNTKTKLIWECKYLHKWETTPMVIQKGSWCPICAKKRNSETRALSLDSMQKIAEEKGGRCLSKRYTNNKTKLLWECQIKHQWEATPKAIKQGAWCPECKKTRKVAHKRYSLQDMIQLAESRDGKCLSKEFKNVRSKIHWECSKKHRWKAVPDSVLRGTWCPICAHDKVISMQRLTLDDMQNLAKKHGGICLSTEYNNFHSMLLWKCKNEHQFKATPKVIKTGTWCVICAYKEGTRHPKYTIQDMQALAENHKGKCLSKKFTNMITKLSWQCEEGHIWETTPHIIQQGSWCAICARKRVGLNKMLSFDEIQAIARLKGGKCISSEYYGIFQELLWKCSKGHVWESTIQKIKNGHWCPECSKKLKRDTSKKDLFFCQSLAQHYAGECLSKTYIDEYRKMTWKCSQEHVWDTTLNSILHNNWCPTCAIKLKVGEKTIALYEDLNTVLIDFKSSHQEELFICELLETDFKAQLDKRLGDLKQKNNFLLYENLNNDKLFQKLYKRLSNKKILLAKIKQISLKHGSRDESEIREIFNTMVDIKDFTLGKSTEEIAKKYNRSHGYISKLARIFLKDKKLFNCRFRKLENLEYQCLEIGEQIIVNKIDEKSFSCLTDPKFQLLIKEFQRLHPHLKYKSIFKANLISPKFTEWLKRLPIDNITYVIDNHIDIDKSLLYCSRINRNQEMLKFIIFSLIKNRASFKDITKVTTKGRHFILKVNEILNTFKSLTTTDYYIKKDMKDLAVNPIKIQIFKSISNLVDNLAKKIPAFYIIRDLYNLNLDEIKKDLSLNPSLLFLQNIFPDADSLILAKEGIYDHLKTIHSQYDNIDPDYINQIFIFVLLVKDQIFGGGMKHIGNIVGFSTASVGNYARFFLDPKAYDKRFLSTKTIKKFILSLAEKIVIGDLRENGFSNIINSQLQDLITEYRRLLGKKRRNGIFFRYKIPLEFVSWLKTMGTKNYRKILQGYNNIISERDMLKICEIINTKGEILCYIIYTIINSTDNSTQIAEVTGISSGTILVVGKVLDKGVSPSTKRFYLENYSKRFKIANL
ncbi:hypothetical protein LCGC14_0685370 [marine sediment metagenome]|uniref:Treble clef zinc finger domain-containing protein n=1 Tax=marine sediment metagenome TaxID=412755 RepID=A0A0F9QM29_9ZZZZ